MCCLLFCASDDVCATSDDALFRCVVSRGAEYESSLSNKQQVVESEHRAKYVRPYVDACVFQLHIVTLHSRPLLPAKQPLIPHKVQ